MSIFSAIASLFNSKKKRDDEWDKNFADAKPAKPDNLLPIDPSTNSMT